MWNVDEQGQCRIAEWEFDREEMQLAIGLGKKGKLGSRKGKGYNR